MERVAGFAKLNRTVRRLATICEVCCWIAVAASVIGGLYVIVSSGIMASIAIVPALLMAAAWVAFLVLLSQVFEGVGTVAVRIQYWLDYDAEHGVFSADLGGPLENIGRRLIGIALLDVVGRALMLIIVPLAPWMGVSVSINGTGLVTIAGFGMLGALSLMLARVFDCGVER